MAEGTLQRTHHTSCVFAISAYSMTSCAAMLQRDADSGMRAKHASSTIARANYHTHLPWFKCPAITLGRTSVWRRRR